MNKAQFNKYVRKVLVKHMRNSNEMEADSIINIFTESILAALEEEDISLYISVLINSLKSLPRQGKISHSL